jgi:DNA-binding protein YbaB
MMDLFGNMEERQKEMKAKLDEIQIEASSPNGEVTVKMTANKRLTDISLSAEAVAAADGEMLEDLLLVTFNEAIQAAEVKAESEMRKQINDMLPGGLGQLFGQ